MDFNNNDVESSQELHQQSPSPNDPKISLSNSQYSQPHTRGHGGELPVSGTHSSNMPHIAAVNTSQDCIERAIYGPLGSVHQPASLRKTNLMRATPHHELSDPPINRRRFDSPQAPHGLRLVSKNTTRLMRFGDELHTQGVLVDQARPSSYSRSKHQMLNMAEPAPSPTTRVNLHQSSPSREKKATSNASKEVESDVDIEDETEEEFMNRLTYLFGQMMFVSGEQAEASPETTWMIEEIVRDQVIEMLKEATTLANRRGSKSISIVDLIFQIRHNPAKVSRLKTFLSWKDVRKNVKDSDDKAGADADALDLEDGALPGANPAAPQKSSTNKKAKLVLPWEIQSYYNETVPEREDEEDEEEEEQNEATLARLASADERTKNMTKEEYVYWSDCRQASFTFRKGKRFREWAGFGTIIDSKPNDDVVDILGFLTFEIVQTLTEEALKVKAAEDLANKKASGLRGDNDNSKKRKREDCTLFEMHEEGRTPVEPKHVREAFRRLQIVPKKYTFLRQGFAGVRTPLRMI